MDRGSVGDSSAAFDSLLNSLVEGGGAQRQAGAGSPGLGLSNLLDPEAHDVVSKAIRATVDWGSREIDSTHLLWAVTQVRPTAEMLADSGVRVEDLATVACHLHP